MSADVDRAHGERRKVEDGRRAELLRPRQRPKNEDASKSCVRALAISGLHPLPAVVFALGLFGRARGRHDGVIEPCPRRWAPLCAAAVTLRMCAPAHELLLCDGAPTIVERPWTDVQRALMFVCRQPCVVQAKSEAGAGACLSLQHPFGAARTAVCRPLARCTSVQATMRAA